MDVRDFDPASSDHLPYSMNGNEHLEKANDDKPWTRTEHLLAALAEGTLGAAAALSAIVVLLDAQQRR